MKVTDRLKQLIFKQLYRELGNAEIIQYKGSIWFINREEKYWYFEFEKAGTLYWRYSFFPRFFTIFSLERDDFEPILTSWVEEVLNHKVSTTAVIITKRLNTVEGVLNHKVSTTDYDDGYWINQVEEVLNHKVSTTKAQLNFSLDEVEGVLNHKVSRTDMDVFRNYNGVEEVLNNTQ
ncbi:hypothetical protein UFOVP117_262 [uncultured Caudovirales phage]|uniref:Uncharacterized protein n=1 Tax=uncultured Caudovirales phage TaxID=2100421 RepID=A0A6J5L6U7_9CAUD|nr:hypothetical protein UFOVP117_262 [uncultured Caudovirales phage]